MDAYIVAGFRTAVGKAKKGGFRFMRPDDLASEVIKHLVSAIPGLENKMVDDHIRLLSMNASAGNRNGFNA